MRGRRSYGVWERDSWESNFKRLRVKGHHQPEGTMPAGSLEDEHLTSFFPSMELWRGSLLAEPIEIRVRVASCYPYRLVSGADSRAGQEEQMEDLHFSLPL